MNGGASDSPPPLCLVAVLGLVFSISASLAVLLAGPGTHFGWWDFRTGFSLLRWGATVGLLAVVTSIIGGVKARPLGPRRGFLIAAIGLALGLIAFGIPWQWGQRAQEFPPIHDITTDMINPPEFVAVLPLRKDAPNPVAYGGPEIAAQQQVSYPHIRPVYMATPPNQAFEKSLSVVRDMGWQIVEAKAAEGRIEATDTTFWFGFKDDIVIRISPNEGGKSRVDIRSLSRVGRGDVGTNAQRITNLLYRLGPFSPTTD